MKLWNLPGRSSRLWDTSLIELSAVLKQFNFRSDERWASKRFLILKTDCDNNIVLLFHFVVLSTFSACMVVNVLLMLNSASSAEGSSVGMCFLSKSDFVRFSLTFTEVAFLLISHDTFFSRHFIFWWTFLLVCSESLLLLPLSALRRVCEIWYRPI